MRVVNDKETESKQEILTCKNCSKPMEGNYHGNSKFCTRSCNDKFHNRAKKEEAQKLQRIGFKVEEQRLNNMLEEALNNSAEIKQIKIDNQLLLESWEVPPGGLIIDRRNLLDSGFRIDVFDCRIQSKRYPGFFFTEHGDYCCIWKDVNQLLILKKEFYLTL